MKWAKVILQYCTARPRAPAHDFRVISARRWIRVHVNNLRDSSQAMLDRKINARFLSNQHDDLYFLLHNNNVNCVLFKKRYSWKRAQNRYSRMQIMTTKTTTRLTLYDPVFLVVRFFRKFYMILIHMLETFTLSSFLPSITFDQLSKM